MLDENTIEELLVDDEDDVKPDSTFKWHVRGHDDAGNDYYLGTVIAKTVGDAQLLAQSTWPGDSATLNWAQIYHAAP